MIKLEITTNLPKRATYIRSVLDFGHTTGTLSGADLRGKARRYGAKYARARNKAAGLARRHNVRSVLVLINSRWARVWVCEFTGQRVRLDVID